MRKTPLSRKAIAAAADFPWAWHAEQAEWFPSMEAPEAPKPPGQTTSVPPRPTNGRQTTLPSTHVLRLPEDLDAEEAYRDTWQEFRHRGWLGLRKKVRRGILDAVGDGPRLDRFDNCGGRPMLQRNVADPKLIRVRCERCGDRFCVPCMRVRAHRMAGRIVEMMPMHAMRFVTLSLKSSARPLKEQFARLQSSFAALRKRPLWRRSQVGGVAFLEVTLNEETGLWHPHLHVLTQGKYVQQAALSAEWRAVTGDSYVVDIRLVRGRDAVIRYVVRYVTKPFSGVIADRPAALAEFVQASRGRRFVTTFGSWRGKALAREEASDGAWADVAPLARVLAQAAEGDPAAAALVQELDRWLFPRDLPHPPPKDPRDTPRPEPEPGPYIPF